MNPVKDIAKLKPSLFHKNSMFEAVFRYFFLHVIKHSFRLPKVLSPNIHELIYATIWAGIPFHRFPRTLGFDLACHGSKLSLRWHHFVFYATDVIFQPVLLDRLIWSHLKEWSDEWRNLVSWCVWGEPVISLESIMWSELLSLCLLRNESALR